METPKFPLPKKPIYQRPGCFVSLLVILILFVVGLVNAIASAGNGSDNTSGSTPTPTQVHTSPTVSKPTPTPTPKPHLTASQRAIQLATSQTLFGKNVTANFNAQELDMTEFLDTNGFLNNGSILTAIKNDCFYIFQAEYKNTTGMSAVDIQISATLQDQYGNNKTGLLAECTLNSGTEAQFNWGNLLPDTAWGDYDYTYTLPSLGS